MISTKRANFKDRLFLSVASTTMDRVMLSRHATSINQGLINPIKRDAINNHNAMRAVMLASSRLWPLPNPFLILLRLQYFNKVGFLNTGNALLWAVG